MTSLYFQSAPAARMFGRSTSNFDRLLEKATSQLLLEPDWTSIMMICDSIRQVRGLLILSSLYMSVLDEDSS